MAGIHKYGNGIFVSSWDILRKKVWKFTVCPAQGYFIRQACNVL
jgi:hypothetical protein